MNTSEPSSASTGPNAINAAVDRYPWDDDQEFQAGLRAILGTNSTLEQAAELTLRARCFYYSRKFNTPIDFDAYKAYNAQHGLRQPPASTNGIPPSATAASSPPEPSIFSASSPAEGAPASSEPTAPYPTSFAHIVELITTGQPIPGIKEIPNTILEGQGTQPVKTKRRKPWEKVTSETSTPGNIQAPDSAKDA